MFEHALQAGAIGTLRLPNRIIMGSMHLGIEGDGAALAAFYVERACGGAGLIVTGGSSVNRVGAGGRNYSFINDPAGAMPLRAAAEAVHAAGGCIALQLFHAGRYAFFDSFGLQPARRQETEEGHCNVHEIADMSSIDNNPCVSRYQSQHGEDP